VSRGPRGARRAGSRGGGAQGGSPGPRRCRREFCEADDRWEAGCAFLGLGDGAGWDLLGGMLDRDWRKRPSVADCLAHPFLTGKSLAPP